MRRCSSANLFKTAPGYLGAFLCLGAALFLSLVSASCRKKSGTPAWHSAPQVVARATATPPPPSSSRGGDLRFVAYNVENWLTMERKGQLAPKPDKEKSAVVELIASATPDVIGLSEIGGDADLADLQARLKSAGCDLPHRTIASGADPVRKLGMLSKFPITAQPPAQRTTYRLNGREFGILRGMLDAVVQTPQTTYHFLGLHLKSKREVPEGDQEQMRRHEAQLVREHIDHLLERDPRSRLIVYGDFNDTRNTSTLSTLKGPQHGATSLDPIFLRDSRGESWTQYWSEQDIYSRFDWVLVSAELKDEIERKASRVIDAPRWHEASDHRPLLTVFKEH